MSTHTYTYINYAYTGCYSERSCTLHSQVLSYNKPHTIEGTPASICNQSPIVSVQVRLTCISVYQSVYHSMYVLLFMYC